MTSLVFHAPSGLSVDPDSGVVFGKLGKVVGGIDPKTGYILVSYGTRKTGVTSSTAHRIVFEAAHGSIPSGWDVAHKNHTKTDNRLCNLELIPHAENVRDTRELMTVLKAEGEGFSVRLIGDIAASAGAKSDADWAEELGVSEKCIRAVRVNALNQASKFSRMLEEAWKPKVAKPLTRKAPAKSRASRSSKKTKAA